MPVSTPSVVRETTLSLVADDHEVPVSARLRYSSADPWAVEVDFLVGEDEWIVWSMARELLHDGMRRVVGEGDVTVWPDRDAAAARLLLRTASPHGAATFAVLRVEIDAFLRECYVRVPRGQESAYLDLDAELNELLAS